MQALVPPIETQVEEQSFSKGSWSPEEAPAVEIGLKVFSACSVAPECQKLC